MRFPEASLPSPTSEDAAAVLEEIIRDIWEAFAELAAKRFFAAGGRAGGIPPVIPDFPVAAARTAEAVTGLFGLDAMKMFFPLGVPEAVSCEEARFPAATTADKVGAAVEPMERMLAVAGIVNDGMAVDAADDDDEAEEADEERGLPVVVVVAVLCFGSICKMSTSGSLMRVAIRVWACLVASNEPLMVIDRSPWTLPCFSTSMWAPVAARMALILLPERPMTREMACPGTWTFLHSMTLDDDWLC